MEAITNTAAPTMKNIEVVVPRPTAIKLSELTMDDLKAMEPEQIAPLCYGLIKAVEELTPHNVRPEVQKPAYGPAMPPKIHRDGHMGTKTGKTSKYHYVSYSSRAKRYMTSIRNGKKTIHVGTYLDEVLAAAGADIYLDSIQDKKRPRNCNEFDEVNAVYPKRKK